MPGTGVFVLATDGVPSRPQGSRAPARGVARLDAALDATIPVPTGDGDLPLAEFLRACAASLDGDAAPVSAAFAAARDAFVRTGLAALTAAADGWVQQGLATAGDGEHRRALYGEVAALLRELLADGSAENAFFLHKPPGLRLRVEPTPGRRADVAAALGDAVATWRSAGLLTGVEPGRYEAEEVLFGGPTSMAFVHALFTVDSLIWLDYHAAPAAVAAESPPWLVSFVLLRHLLDGLDVRGWEDLGVWDAVRDDTGRRLPPDGPAPPGYRELGDGLRDLWSRSDRVTELLHPQVRELLDGYVDAVREGAQRWRAGYFAQEGATLGPRAGAATFVVFHWNRAGLPAIEQSLIAESLAQRVTS